MQASPHSCCALCQTAGFKNLFKCCVGIAKAWIQGNRRSDAGERRLTIALLQGMVTFQQQQPSVIIEHPFQHLGVKASQILWKLNVAKKLPR